MEKINPYYRNMMIKVNEEIDEKLVFELDSLLADLATKYSYNSTRWIYLYSTSKEDRIYFKNNVQYEDRNKKYKLTMNDDIIAFFKNLNEVVKYLKDTINYKRFLEQELKIFYKHIALTLDSEFLGEILEIAKLDKGKMSFNVQKDLLKLIQDELNNDDFKFKLQLKIVDKIKTIRNNSYMDFSKLEKDSE